PRRATIRVVRSTTADQRRQASRSTSASFGLPSGPTVRACSTSFFPAGTVTPTDALHVSAAARSGENATVAPSTLDGPTAATAATSAATDGSVGSTFPVSDHADTADGTHFAKRASVRAKHAATVKTQAPFATPSASQPAVPSLHAW